MRKTGWTLTVVCTAIIAFHACRKAEEYPVEPVIRLESFVKIFNSSQGIFDRGIMTLSFTDGDGDIGLGQNDTVAPYDYNFIIRYFEVQHGDTVEEKLVWFNKITQTYDTINHNARIPYLTARGDKKGIKGEIEDTLQIYNYNSGFDTVFFEAYIIDRALHKSNVVVTPPIIRN
ncbi:MAG: hypothetical protein JXA03_00030 [Bacteroidales bacterium]|nr:hypothetical protein [Bacteroidales bacterium]